jgi:hypothetical protein
MKYVGGGRGVSEAIRRLAVFLRADGGQGGVPSIVPVYRAGSEGSCLWALGRIIVLPGIGGT